MSEKTLYLVQSHFANTQSMLNKLSQLCIAQDSIVLMGDTVLAVQAQRFQSPSEIYILENDAELLAASVDLAVKIINYAEFAELVLSHTRCISLK